MTFEEALKELKAGKEIRRKGWKNKNYCLYKRGNDISDCNGFKLFSDIFFDDWEVVCEGILDGEERKYLSNVIKPFREEVDYIVKDTFKEKELIVIAYKDPTQYITALPCFKKGTMYKGMKVNKGYSLKELGL